MIGSFNKRQQTGMLFQMQMPFLTCWWHYSEGHWATKIARFHALTSVNVVTKFQGRVMVMGMLRIPFPPNFKEKETPSAAGRWSGWAVWALQVGGSCTQPG